MAVVERLRSSNYKILLLILKYIPAMTALCYMMNTLFSCVGLSFEPLSNIAGMSLFTWIFVYLSSIVFEFCTYHRLFLWYIFADDILNITDYYWEIPVSTDMLLMIHNILMGVMIFMLGSIYVVNHKKSIKENNK